MVPTWGHLIGFIHVILVMAQGSLMFLRVHLNKRWMFLLEILVLPHAFQVALNQSSDIWPMFFFRLRGHLSRHADARPGAEALG